MKFNSKNFRRLLGTNKNNPNVTLKISAVGIYYGREIFILIDYRPTMSNRYHLAVKMGMSSWIMSVKTLPISFGKF